MLEIDCTILTPEVVLKASGHVKKFADIMVRDELTNEPFRADHLLKSIFDKMSVEKSDIKDLLRKIENCQVNDLEEIDQIIEKYNIRSPLTGNKLLKAAYFNLMFQTKVGTSESNRTYLRPETAQGIFMNFQRLFNFKHKKLPLIVGEKTLNNNVFFWPKK
jgi:glycyl-tRNA synthetase